MIFAGSDLDECVPYFLGSPTNAWTLEDHTCYQLRCASADGFCRLIKAYLRALYSADLSTAFDAEVKGVVTAEILADESSETSLMRLLAKHLYHSSPYSFDAGGTSEGLRSLSPSVLQKFHQEHYFQRLLLFLVTSDPHEKLLEAVRSSCVGDKRRARDTSWRAVTIPPFPREVNAANVLRSEETSGLVVAAWELPPWPKQQELAAAAAIFAHLTSGAKGGLYDELVLVQAACGSIEVAQQEYGCRSALIVKFIGVPVENMKPFADGVHEKVKEALRRLPADREELLRPAIVAAKHEVWVQPDLTLATSLIGAFLYADDMQRAFGECFVPACHLQQIVDQWDASDWAAFVENTFVQNAPFVLFGKPMGKQEQTAAEAEEEAQQPLTEVVTSRERKRLRRRDHSPPPDPGQLLAVSPLELRLRRLSSGVCAFDVAAEFARVAAVLPFLSRFKEAALWALAALSLPLQGAAETATAWQVAFSPLSLQGKLSSVAVNYGNYNSLPNCLFFEICAPVEFAAEAVAALLRVLSKPHWEQERLKMVARRECLAWEATTFEEEASVAEYALEWSLYRHDEAVKAQNPLCMISWMKDVAAAGCPTVEGLHEQAGGVQLMFAGGLQDAEIYRMCDGFAVAQEGPQVRPLLPAVGSGRSAIVLGLSGVSSHALKFAAAVNPCEPAAAFLIWAEALKRTGGDLWRAVRGSGCAYGFDVGYEDSDGLFRFEITEAAGSPAAAAVSLLELVMSPSELSLEDFQLAKAGALLEAAELLDTQEMQIQASFAGTLSRKRALVAADIEAITFDHFSPRCLSSACRLAWACPKAAVQGVVKSVSEMGFSVEFAGSLADFARFVDTV
jgi:predicted Zn-dependent peptidase